MSATQMAPTYKWIPCASGELLRTCVSSHAPHYVDIITVDGLLLGNVWDRTARSDVWPFPLAAQQAGERLIAELRLTDGRWSVRADASVGLLRWRA